MFKMIWVSVAFMGLALACFMVRPGFDSSALFAVAAAFAAWLSHLEHRGNDQAKGYEARIKSLEEKVNGITIAAGFRF